MDIPNAITTEELALIAFAMVILSKVIDRLLSVIENAVAAKRNGGAHNGRDKANLEGMCEQLGEVQESVTELSAWHKVEGAGLVRIMNAAADHIRTSTSVLQRVERRVEDNHAEMVEIRRVLVETRRAK